MLAGLYRWGWRRVGIACTALGLAIGSSLEAADRVYVVRKNDTLSRIARQHGVKVEDLTRHNRLSNRDKIYTGQRLLIPPKPGAADPVLSAVVRAAIAKAPVTRGRWKYIVIHHSATEVGSAQGMDDYHRRVRHMENGLAYHFVIGNGHGMPDGEVAVGHRWTRQLDGGHVRSAAVNRVALGICLVGHFDHQKPTTRQMRSLQALVVALMDRCALPASSVKTHQQINATYTRCPGKHFPTRSFQSTLRSLR